MNGERTKSFDFSIEEVLLSFISVKENKGGNRVERGPIEAFEKDLKGNVYKIWNRLSSGSYMPPSVEQVMIPRKQGGARTLGDTDHRRPSSTRSAENYTRERESWNLSFISDHMVTD